MINRYIFAFALFLSLGIAPALLAQGQDAETKMVEAAKADVESIDAITAAVYDVISGAAGEKRDWDRFRSLFRPEAKLIPLGVRDGVARSRAMSIDDYVTNVGPQLEQGGFFEIETHRVQEQYGHIAHHFSTYESRRNADDPEPFMRGINSFQLMNDGNRWWVVNIFWQGETPEFPIPAKYLPKG